MELRRVITGGASPTRWTRTARCIGGPEVDAQCEVALLKHAGVTLTMSKLRGITHEKYDRLVAEWLANGRVLPQPAPPPEVPDIILHLIAAYWRWATASPAQGSGPD